MEEDEHEIALTLQIGRVARAHVELDTALRGLFQALVYPSPAVYLAEEITSTSRLVSDCRTMLKRVPTESRLMDAGLGALTAAKVVNEERNRVVHDVWWPMLRFGPDEPPRWEVLRTQKFHSDPSSQAALRGLDSVQSVLTALRRVTLRITGLDMALWETLPRLKDEAGGLDQTTPDRWLALAADEFELLHDGSVRVQGGEPFSVLRLPADED